MFDKNRTRRKLQFAGNSSYVLTLPKKWINAVGLNNKNAEVIIEELPDGTVRILPVDMFEESSERSEQILLVTKKTNKDEIVRLILACYLASKSSITIKTDKIDFIPVPIVNAINDITQKLWGSEIIEETSSQIIIHDALNPSQMRLEEIIQKAWFTAKNMLSKSFQSIFEKDGEIALLVQNSERTLDKLYYLALRQLYKASSNMLFASKIGILPSDIIDYHLLIKNIERIGDHSEQISLNFHNKIENVETLKRAAEVSKIACQEAISSFLKDDYKTAQVAINKKKEVIEMIGEIEISYSEFSLSKSILRIADYASDIGELVINRAFSNS